MNSWRFTGIILKTPVIHDKGGIITIQFTVINTEKILDEMGNVVGSDITPDIDCVWKNPDYKYEPEWRQFKEKAVVELQGRPKLRKYTRDDRTAGYSLHCIVHKGFFKVQFSGQEAERRRGEARPRKRGEPGG